MFSTFSENSAPFLLKVLLKEVQEGGGCLVVLQTGLQICFREHNYFSFSPLKPDAINSEPTPLGKRDYEIPVPFRSQLSISLTSPFP